MHLWQEVTIKLKNLMRDSYEVNKIHQQWSKQNDLTAQNNSK